MFTISKDTIRRRKKFGRTEVLNPNFIVVRDREREVDSDEELAKLADSMSKQGLESPITVRLMRDLANPDDLGETILVAGARRLAAAKALGWDAIECHVHVNMTDDEAKMVELAENRFREELDTLTRAEWFGKWKALHDKQSAGADYKPNQVGSVSTKGGRGKKGGVREAAQQAGISQTEAQRLAHIAKLPAEAKKTAKEVGLDDNQSALLAAAKVHKEGGDPVATLKAEADNRKAKRFAPKPTKIEIPEEGTEAPGVVKFRAAKAKRASGVWKDWIEQQVRERPDMDPYAAIAEGLAAAGYTPPVVSAPATAPDLDDLAPVASAASAG